MQNLNSTTFFHYDTTCAIAADVDERVLAEAERLCDRYELIYSRFDPESSLSRVNAAQGRWTQVEEELASAITTALWYCERTSGLFDITMGSACAIWDFKQGIVPTDDEIAQARAHVGWRQVEIDGNRVRLVDPQATIDLGGIAKGIIADALVSFLVDKGAASGYVNLGGNVVCIGSKPDGQPWNVGIRSPGPSFDPFNASTCATLSVVGKSVVTSGIFERACAHDGQLLHHILDPRTGAPAVTDLLSATIVADRSTDADGFTTSLVIMGAEYALAFAEARPEIEAILLTASGDILHTSGITGEGTHFRA